MPNVQHPQETILETFDFKGIAVDLVEWKNTIWCGKVGYADNNADEPDVEKLMKDFMSISAAPNGREENWDICMSLNYLTDQRPSGVMFGFLVAGDAQPEEYDICKIPAAKFLRVRMCDETAKALGHAPWTGGIPPYQWIGEQIAPELGYTYGSDALPIVEYYGFYGPVTCSHEYCYLYVPVDEAAQ